MTRTGGQVSRVLVSTMAVVRRRIPFPAVFIPVAALLCRPVAAFEIAVDGPALPREFVSQQQIEFGPMSLARIRRAGLMVYTAPFNRADGLGDGPFDPGSDDATSFGERPGLQTADTPFLRVNGLDTQSCVECHAIHSRRTIPPTFAIGGHGGLNNSAFFLPSFIDVSDRDGNGFAATDGRVINPPFNFGGGGIELLAKEMTADLQGIRRQAEQAAAGTVFQLETKGVSFGTATANGDGTLTLSIDGGGRALDSDLVVRPFGRKGAKATLREFDLEAMQFHLGLQPVEIVGSGVDEDDDGIADEVTVGEISALSVFLASLPPPAVRGDAAAVQQGAGVFQDLGCAQCHRPELVSESAMLSFSYPEVPQDPQANVYLTMDLSQPPIGFEAAPGGGVRVPLFADLKRHDMGAALAETAGGDLDRFFTTARLWGVADSAPYLHDGRAATLREAIVAHGGEAESSAAAFEQLPPPDQQALLRFLGSLRVPDLALIQKLTR